MRGTFLKYHISWPIVLIATALIAQFTIVDFDLGPASLRVYIIFGLLYLLILYMMQSGRMPLLNNEASGIVKIYVAFMLWIFLVRLHNNEPLGIILRHLLSSHFLALAGFTVIQFFAKNRNDAVLLASVMTVTSLFSAFAGVMQWLGIKWFWDLALMIHPLEKTRELLLGTKLGSWGFVPGLAQYSIPFSYHLITFGLFTLSWTMYKTSAYARPFTRMWGLFGIAILSSAVLFSQSRSAIFSYFIGVLFIVWNIRRDHIRRAKRAAIKRKSFVVVVVISAAILWCYIYSKGFSNVDIRPGEGGYQLTRTLSSNVTTRLILTYSALESISDNLLFGSYSQYETILSESEISHITLPHNMFLNAIVYYGLPGLVFLLLLLKTTYTICAKAIRLTRFDETVAWVAYGAVAGLLAYILHGQFHNDSFVTGGTLPWWLLGLLCAVIRQKNSGRGSSVR